MLSNEDQEGFLVSDGHLSDEEYNFSNEGANTIDKRVEIEMRRQRYKQNQSKTSPTIQGKPVVLLSADDLKDYTCFTFS